nr:hypothetical protein [Tanacetum cinerariifolium]
MAQNIDFSGSDQIQTLQYPEVHPPSEISNEYSKPKNPNELFQKLLEDLKELAEYDNSPSKDRPIFLNDNEEHSVQNEESLENPSNEIATSSSNQEKEEPPQDSDIYHLIEEYSTEEVKNVVKQPAERGSLAPILSTKETEYSSNMGYEHSNTTPETESDEIIKSGVEELVAILSENEVTLEDKRECDVPISKSSPICDDHSDIFSDFKDDDDISSDDDDFEDVEYVEASLSDPEIVSVEEENGVEEENVVHQAEENDVEEEEDDLEDISQIQDVDLREKLLSITQFKTFCNHTEETRSGNTTHADNSLPEYDSFCFEIEPDQEWLINVMKNDIPNDSSNDALLEEADLFLAYDNSIPPVPRPPPEPPDAEFDAGKEIPVVMNDKDEDVDYSSFIFVIYPEMFTLLLSAESEDTIFDPGIST